VVTPKPARTYTIPLDAEWDGGIPLRIRHGIAEWRLAGSWGAAPLRLLTRHHAADSELWAWLRSWGVTRVSTSSGPSGKRVTPRPRRVDYCPSPEALERLHALAASRCESYAAVLDRLVLGAVE
jgi:hypothetical protein